MPRLPMLVKLAHALGISDLAELTGNGEALPVQTFAGGTEHAMLSEVQTALTAYRLAPNPQPANLAHLAERLDVAWRLRHSSPDHRTQVGALLPALIRDARSAVRAHSGAERRQARRILAGVYRLAQFYTAYQPAPELVWLVTDRSLSEAQDADDPYAIASGAWGLVQALRESGRWDEALSVAEDGRDQLESPLDGAGDDWRGLYGALVAEDALTHARRGKHGPAWREWERAHGIARKLGAGYRHRQSSFSLAVMGAYAVSIGVDLHRTGEALQAAHTVEADTIASVPRRARHLIEVARVHHKRDERAASLATLESAEHTAPETARYNGFAREMVADLMHAPPTGQADVSRGLAERLGLLVR